MAISFIIYFSSTNFLYLSINAATQAASVVSLTLNPYSLITALSRFWCALSNSGGIVSGSRYERPTSFYTATQPK